MELKEFVRIFLKEKRLILMIVATSLVLGLALYRLQGQSYAGTVLLTVTRIAGEATMDYRYDQLYRLQADERMADTVARYLESEIGMKTASEKAGLGKESSQFFTDGKVEALRTSSQIVQVKFRAKTPTEVERIADAILESGERYVASLNEQAKERNWFTLLSPDVSVKDGRFDLLKMLFIALVSGFLLSFWTVLIRWYWNGGAGLSATKNS